MNNLRLHGNISENWSKFKQNYKSYETDTELTTKPDEVRIAALLNAFGDEAVELFYAFNLTDDERKNYETVIKAFDDHCKQNNRILNARFLFFSRNQNALETFDSFLMDIKTLAEMCQFEDQKKLLMRDRIVSGISDKAVQEKLLREDNLSFDKAVEIGRAAELDKQQKIPNSGESNLNEAALDTCQFEDKKKLLLRDLIVSGIDTQQEIQNSLKSNVNEAALDTAGIDHDNVESIEQTLLKLDSSIKSCIQLKSADLDQAIRLLETYKSIKYTKIWLTVHPQLVLTMKKLRKYVGNSEVWGLTDQQKTEFYEKAAVVRGLAENILYSFKSLFDVPEGRSFEDVFNEEVRLLLSDSGISK